MELAIKSFFQFLVLSLILHALALAWSVVPSSEEDETVNEPLPIRVRISHTEKKLTKEQDGGAVLPKKDVVKKTVGKSSSVKPASVEVQKTFEANAETPALSYSDLFPPNSAPGSDASAGSEGGSEAKGSGSYDEESDGFSFDEKARNLVRLGGFARELSERISVPGALKELEPTGKAFLRFRRKGEGWQIASVHGDPYYRALLYEVMAKLPRQSHAYHLLSETDYDSVRIYFSFRTASSLDQTVKPVETKTDANKVFINITYQESGVAWQIAAPQTNERGETKVGLNLIGVGLMAYKAVKNDDPGDDIEARKLRLSPAFARPIGR